MTNLRKCDCGNEVNYDGYNEIKIEESYIIIKGDAICEKCGKEFKYTECYEIDFKNPNDVELEEV